MKHLLVIRFSAMGDVAMSIPVIKGIALSYPQLKITVLTSKKLAPIFSEMPLNVDIIGADIRQEYKGVDGLERLCSSFLSTDIDAVADLHDVLRSKYIRHRLHLAGCKVKKIHKGRFGKWLLTRQYLKHIHPLKTSVERYESVFKRLGLSIKDNYRHSQINNKTRGEGIGIAPFAAHKGKIYPIELMEQVVKQLAEKSKEKIYLFGGGEKEKAILESWANRYDLVESVAGRYTLEEEIKMIGKLRVMLTMDSANMHLASLVGTRVVSVWGQTHPFAGFLGFGQNINDCVQINSLSCRPCSIYGNKKCKYGDYRCLSQIKVDDIVTRILE